MATYYLKNVSGSKKTVGDIGLIIKNGNSTNIDSNNIDGYLSAELQASLLAGAANGLVLSTTDTGDTSGDMTPAQAIAALTITTRFDVDNPHKTSFTQSIAVETVTDTTAAELERLTNGTDASSVPALHNHDSRYYTETELSQSNPATVSINWDNIKNPPSFGSLDWQAPAKVIVLGLTANPTGESWVPVEGNFYVDTVTKDIYEYSNGTWGSFYTPLNGDRVVNNTDKHIYTFSVASNSWVDTGMPDDNWVLLVNNDGDGKSAQYIYDSAPAKWVKIADVDWGSHAALADRQLPGAHPATAISYDHTTSRLNATTVQAAIDELLIEGLPRINNLLYVSKDGSDTPPSTGTLADLGSIALPFATIQTAINSVPLTGIHAVSATNRYAIYLAPGDYSENITLSKNYVYVIGAEKSSVRIIGSGGNTVTLPSTSNNVNGLFNITVENDSTSGNDNAILMSGNNQEIRDCIIYAQSGARAIFITGAYTHTIRDIEINGGEFRIDAGVTHVHDLVTAGGVNITGGTVRLIDIEVNNALGDGILQSGGTVYIISGKSVGGAGLDYNQTSGTVYIGWLEYVTSLFNGSKNLLFKSIDLSYDHTASGLQSTQVQAAIDELVAVTGAQLTKYIVGKDSFDKYSSIQAAITQATADGHNTTSPAIVIVKPGIYTENVVLKAGIHVQSLITDDAYSTGVMGHVTFATTGVVSWDGIDITESSGSAVVFSSSNLQTLKILNSEILNQSDTVDTVSATNSNSLSNLIFVNSNLNNLGNGIVVNMAAAKLSITQTKLTTVGVNALSLGGEIDSTSCLLTGGVLLTGTSSGLVLNSYIKNGVNAAITCNSTGILSFIDSLAIDTGLFKAGTHPENVIVKRIAADVPYSNTISGLAAVDVQAAIDEIVLEFGVELDNIVFVSKNGNDASSGVKVGTISNPFLTVQAAINSISDASASKYYSVFVYPGIYSESVAFKPWVSVCGLSKETVAIKSSTSGTHTISMASGGKLYLKDLNLGNSTQLFNMTHPASSSSSCSVIIDNCNLGIPTFNMLGGGVDSVQFKNDTYAYGKTTVHSGAMIARDSTFAAGLLIDDTGVEHVDGAGKASSNVVDDCLGTTLECAGNTLTEFYNNPGWLTLTGTGATCVVKFDVGSAPDTLAQIISASGATFTRTDNAFAVAYNNTTSGMVSTQVQAAIDELKTGISNFKMPQGTAFPTSHSDGDLFYRTDMAMPFQYDASRGKWLSLNKLTLDWGTSSGDGKYMQIHGSTATQSGYLMPRRGTVISITIKIASGNQTKPLELRKNNGVWSATPADYTFTPGSNGAFSKTDLNLSFDALDYVQTFLPSSGFPARDIVAMCEIAYEG